MNKKRVNEWIPVAKEALKKADIAKNGKIDSTYRSQISSFGAFVTLGSLKSAVAFFSKKGNATTERPQLLSAMFYVATGEWSNPETNGVFNFVCENACYELQERFLDASVALKLAMNFFELTREE